MKNKKTEILFYTKYHDRNGVVHHEIQRYIHTNQTVIMLKDFKFFNKVISNETSKFA